jgi:hypothetical protein
MRSHEIRRKQFQVVMAMLVIGCGPLLRAARADIEAEQVRQSIERGVVYLKREQGDNGSWKDQPQLAGALSALCTLELRRWDR